MKNLKNIVPYFSIAGVVLFLLYHFLLFTYAVLISSLGIPNLRIEFLVFPIAIYLIYLSLKPKVFEVDEYDLGEIKNPIPDKIRNSDYQQNLINSKTPEKKKVEIPLYSDEHYDLIFYGLGEISKKYKQDFQIAPTLIFKKNGILNSKFFTNFSHDELDLDEIEILLNSENPEIAVIYHKGVYDDTNVVFIRIYNRTNFYIIKFMKSYWELFIETKPEKVLKPIEMAHPNPIFDGSTLDDQ